MAVETPARIAVMGAGPIGLEAALYARFLGYDVDVYERGRVAEHLLQWGHVRLFTPFNANCSSLGLAALANQDDGWRPPDAAEFLTGRELAERYYVPLSKSDLLVDHIHQRTEVLAVGRGGLLKGDMAGEDRSDADFRLLVRDAHSAEPAGRRFVTADVVIDATGTFGQHNWLGEGGIPAIGELLAESHIEYGLPDILGERRADFAHRHTLVVGDGHAAAASVVSLARLGHEAPYTQVTWVVRREADKHSGPIRRIANDPWPARDQLAEAANRLLHSEPGHLIVCPSTVVRRVIWHEGLDKFQVSLGGQHAGEIEVDRIVANVGHRPNNQLFAELQVGEDPIRGAATRWPAAGEAQPDRLLLATAEPDFYVLGAKSLGRDSRFTIAAGLEQIRELFTILGDRPDLDLYSSVR